MDELWKSLQMRKKELEDAIIYAENILKNAPKGFLRIVKNKNTEQYYMRDNPKNSFGVYIRKSNMKLIENLAQKDYAEKLLKQLKRDREKVQKFINEYSLNSMEKVYEELASKRKKLVKPYILPDEEFVNQWMQTSYNKKEIMVEVGSEIVTEKGEVVRSKSEKILADKLNLMNIPYHYEQPLFLNGYGTIHPDFTVLNKSTRKEYYWEHFGLMDNPEYCEKAIKKIETMQKNGIYIGEKLIVTFETQSHPLNMKIVENTIKKYLK